MVVPALLYSRSTPAARARTGWGILDGDRHRLRARRARAPRPGPARRLRVFLLTLAIVDDIGAIVVIAIFYSRASISSPSRRPAVRPRRSSLLGRVRVVARPGYFVAGARAVARDAGVRRPPDDRRRRARACSSRRYPPRRERRRAGRRSLTRLPPAPAPELARSAMLGLGAASRRTSGCRSSCTRGRATSSSRSSRWRTPASRSAATLICRAAHARRSRSASSSASSRQAARHRARVLRWRVRLGSAACRAA